MEYTHAEMMNQLMWAEEEYYDHNKSIQEEKTREQWLKIVWDEYTAFDLESLRDMHRDRVDAYYEEGAFEDLVANDKARLAAGELKMYVNEPYCEDNSERTF